MRGFFNRQQIGLAVTGGGSFSCVSCGLYKRANSPKMEPYGLGKKGIMIIGEFPTSDDDQAGEPWQDKAGKFLQRTYRRFGIDLYEDCITLNAVNCNTPKNRNPSGHEINCCRSVKILPAIKNFQPKVIVLHGRAAVVSVLGQRWKSDLGTLARWVGWTIPDRYYNAWICPTYPPNMVERNKDEEVRILWERHIEQAVKLVDKPFPPETTQDQVVVTNDAASTLESILEQKPEYLAFDIETTGLKPYDHDKHQIFCIAFASSPDQATVIPAPKNQEEHRLLSRVLRSPRIKKIAANLKYEHIWIAELYGIDVYPWDFDTMLAAHVLDNRTNKTSGLKFQSYINFGVVGYDDEVEPYLSAENAYSVNRVGEFVRTREGYNKLATYCGMDAMLTYRLAQLQKEALGI